MEFYEKHLAKLDDRRFELNEAVKGLNEKISIIQNQINQLRAPRGGENREVTIVLNTQSTEETSVHLRLAYIISNASWHASYDCRVQSSNMVLQLIYYGSITNSTGEDWNNVHINLSTAKPSAGGTPPTLPTSRVQLKVPVPVHEHYYNFDMASDMVIEKEMMVERSLSRDLKPRRETAPKKPVAVLTSTATQGASSTTFNIPRSSTILSDSKPRKVTITIVDDLKPKFSYTIVPSKNPDAFLKGTVTNSTTNYPFLAGPMAIFMDNNFVTTSYIEVCYNSEYIQLISLQLVNPQEEFSLFLGMDSSIKVEYLPVKKYTEGGGILSRIKTQHVQCHTTIKNTKVVEIEVAVLDQLPVSHDDKIKVKLLEPNLKEEKARLNEYNNLEWKLHIPAGGKIEIPFKYDIEYPKDKEVEIAE